MAQPVEDLRAALSDVAGAGPLRLVMVDDQAHDGWVEVVEHR